MGLRLSDFEKFNMELDPADMTMDVKDNVVWAVPEKFCLMQLFKDAR